VLWTLGAKRGELTAASMLAPESADLLGAHARALESRNHRKAALGAIEQALLVGYDFGDEFFRIRTLDAVHGHHAASLEWHRLSINYPFLITPLFELGKIAEANNAHPEAQGYYTTLLGRMQYYPAEIPIRVAAQKRLNKVKATIALRRRLSNGL